MNSSDDLSTKITVILNGSYDTLGEDSAGKLSNDYILLAVMIGLLAILGIAGNVPILIVYVRKKDKNASNTFIKVLACLDLLVCSFVMPYTALYEYHMVSSDVACRLFELLRHFAVMASNVTLAAIALERYIAVVKINTKLDARCLSKGIAVILLTSLITAVPAVGVFTVVSVDEVSDIPCSFPHSKTTGSFCHFTYSSLGKTLVTAYQLAQVFIFFLLLMIISTLYIIVYVVLWRKTKTRERLTIRRNECSMVNTNVIENEASNCMAGSPDDNKPMSCDVTENDLATNTNTEFVSSTKSESLSLSSNSRREKNDDSKVCNDLKIETNPLSCALSITTGKDIKQEDTAFKTDTLVSETMDKLRTPFTIHIIPRTSVDKHDLSMKEKLGYNECIDSEPMNTNSVQTVIHEDNEIENKKALEEKTDLQKKMDELVKGDTHLTLNYAPKVDFHETARLGAVKEIFTKRQSATQDVLGKTSVSFSSITQRRRYSHHRTAKMLFLCTVIYFITWIPFWLDIFGFTNSKSFRHLFFIGNAMNPLVYGLVNQQVRRSLKLLFNNCLTYCCSWSPLIQNASSTTPLSVNTRNFSKVSNSV